MIRAESFSKSYEKAVAVDDLSFQVNAGQVLGLVGRNGAGKTTTLKSIAGIIPLSAGRLLVDDFEVTADPIAVKQRSAYVPDDPHLFNDLTVEQHLLFTAGVYGIENPHHEIDRLLATFELLDKRHTAASGLSRGMKQKLAISCALLQQPSALLLDEPMTGLDPQGIRNLKATILEQAKCGTAIIISSHLLAMVEDICSDVMILENGKRKFFGRIEELKEQFAGDSNSELRTLEEIYFATMEMVPESDEAKLPKAEPDDSECGERFAAEK
ncbi:ABC transporter ATP-binding protein [Mariniblastus fucicola]|uniref:ABC-type transporter ATP-binding protein EcsA n=1 Tax=Mariniblastus fucicola TaxID=980251 RepID=A0A5B9PJQ4_9BACT|nr:ABC transporter ATP-binding protein [Mariniblastus fucicola]QEG22743.1 ABC-type transporter ATP-binding protein EcsA [Mariniblastus fucicola]